MWRYPCLSEERDGPQDDPSGVAVRSCLLIVYNLLLDRVADGSWGILCQASSDSPELFISQTSRQQNFSLLSTPWLCQNGEGNPEKRGARLCQVCFYFFSCYFLVKGCGICCKTKSQWGTWWLVKASLPSDQSPSYLLLISSDH